MQDCNVIAKGSYSQFRFNDFVSVRQYLLIRENGKKYLILKLSNDAKDTVTGLKLAVEQLDGRGACIETSHVEWTDINGLPGEKFVPNEKIALRESCVEVKIRLTGATYGEYVCEVKSDELVVTYDKKTEESTADYTVNTKGEKSVKQVRKYKVPHILAIASVLVLICSLVLTALQLWQFREKETTFRWKDVRYEFIDGKEEGDPIRVVGYSGVSRNITIPAEIEGYPVVEVAKEAFFDQDRLYSVDILANVTIGEYAFSGCDNLFEVKIAGAPFVDEYAFSDCVSLEYVTANNVEEFGAGAFAGCTSLRELYIAHEDEDTILCIGNEAFKNCKNLNVVVIDQIIEYTNKTDFLKSARNVTKLELKNYNSAKYEKATNKPLATLFGGKLPSQLQTLKIADIDGMSTSFCANLTALQSVSLGGFSASRIPAKAFNGCTQLTELNLVYDEEADLVTSIGEYAFFDTKIPTFDCSAVESIGNYAFANNDALTDVSMASNDVLCELGEGAFANCTSLKSIKISGLVEEIPKSAFENCARLATLALSETGDLKVIGESAFSGCESLTNLQLPKGVIRVEDYAFTNCSALNVLNLPRNLQEIGDYAFSGCASLMSVEIPYNATYVGVGAFAYCAALSALKTPFIGCTPTTDTYLAAIFGGESYMDTYVFPENLQTLTVSGTCDVADYAFYGAKCLKYVHLTGEISSIGGYAFAGCSNLRELHLGPTIQQIQDTAFLNCYTLFEIWNNTALGMTCGSTGYGGIAQYALAVYGADEERMDYVKANDFSCVMTETGWYITDYVGTESDWVLPDTFTSQAGDDVTAYTLPAFVFAENKQVKTLKFGRGATAVGQSAFMACPSLESVNATAAKEWGKLESYTFSACPALTTVTLPSTMGTICDQAFEYSVILQDVALPANLIELGEKAFYACESLEEITLPASLQVLGESVFEGAISLQSVDLSNTALISIPTATFYGCISLTSVKTEGAKFEYIGEYAFYNTALTEFVFPSSLQNIGPWAFANSKLQAVTVTHDLYMIDTSAFAYAEVKEFNVLANISIIGESAFAYAGLQEVNILGMVSVLSEGAFAYSTVQNVAVLGAITTMEERAFYSCDMLTSVSFADYAITSIPANTFFYCSQLKEISLGEGITSIGEGAFAYAAATEIALPSTVETIGYSAFANCYDLSIIFLSKSLTNIDYDAFVNCYALYEVFNPSSLPITRGSYDYGYVAVYALIVHESLDAERMTTEIKDGVTYKCAPTEKIACVYACEENAPKTLDFSSLELNGVTYEDLWVYTYAFYQNSTIEELNTGLITEIQSYAFAECTALKKVTLGNVLQAEKVSFDAFVNCYKLWEVHTTREDQALTQGGWEYGQVAYYALTINQNIVYGTYGNFEFMYFDGEWRMYKYNGEGNEELPEIGTEYQIYMHPMFYDPPFSWNESGYFVIPTSVIYLSSGVFGNMSSGQSLYYKGTQEEWIKLTENVGWYNASVYYYNDCVHNGYRGTQYWTYLNGKPTTSDTELREILTEATCQSSGLQEWVCDICDEIIYSVYLEQLPHEPTSKVVEQPTCEEMGLEEWTCKVCGEFLYNTYISATGHTEKDAVVKQPTCEENGLKEWTCEVCGKLLYNEELPATGHLSGTEKVTKEPTCQAIGLKEWICDECGKSIYAENLPMVAHSFTEKDGSCTWCKQRPVAENDLGDLLLIKTAGDYKFFVKEDGGFYTDWRSDYNSYMSELLLTAQTDVILSFTVRLETNKKSFVNIEVNGETVLELTDAGKEGISLTLSKGDTLSILFTYNPYDDKEARLYIEDFTVEEYAYEPADTDNATDTDTDSEGTASESKQGGK